MMRYVGQHGIQYNKLIKIINGIALSVYITSIHLAGNFPPILKQLYRDNAQSLFDL